MRKPKRVQRRRTKGWKMPANTIYVGRPSRWGNPFKVGVDGTTKECFDKYEKLMFPYNHKNGTLENMYMSMANMADIAMNLAGKNLACFCPLGSPCHADILFEVANTYIPDHLRSLEKPVITTPIKRPSRSTK